MTEAEMLRKAHMQWMLDILAEGTAGNFQRMLELKALVANRTKH